MPTRGRILIVDDSDDNVVYMSQILQHYGFDYDVARSGAEALEAMRKATPSLVLLDVMMPKQSGVSVYLEMKDDPKLEDVPIVFVTGASLATGVDMMTGEPRLGGPEHEGLPRDLGYMLSETLQGLEPDGFVEKPIHPPTLVAKIKELLE